MKILKIKVALILFSILISTHVSAQDFQGVAVYQTKTTVDMNNFGGRQMSDQQKKMIAERMKSMLEKEYVLTFNRSESIYKEDEKLEAPGQSGSRWGGMMGSFTGGTQYKNVKENQLMQQQEFFGKQFLINDSLQKLDWKMENESKQIGQYTVFKATAIKEVDDMDFTNWRRRGNDNEQTDKKQDSTKTTEVTEEITVPKQIVVTAWYSPQIPVNQGPAEYWGLPGLILEVNAGRTTMLCTKIVLNPEEKEELKAPKKGEEVSRAEFNEIMKKKMEEMREMFRNRGGRRSN